MYSIGSQELVTFLRTDLPSDIKKFILDLYENGITETFWRPHIKNRMNRFVDNGVMYSKGFGNSMNPGFGGQWFEIRFLKDNTSILSNNVWHQGPIPNNLRDYLPDNAIVAARYQPCSIA